jgi:hypothetical protein
MDKTLTKSFMKLPKLIAGEQDSANFNDDNFRDKQEEPKSKDADSNQISFPTTIR